MRLSCLPLISAVVAEIRKLVYFAIAAGDNVTVSNAGTSITISATTGAKTLISASNGTVNVNSSGATYYISANTSSGGSSPPIVTGKP